MIGVPRTSELLLTTQLLMNAKECVATGEKEQLGG